MKFYLGNFFQKLSLFFGLRELQTDRFEYFFFGGTFDCYEARPDLSGNPFCFYYISIYCEISWQKD